MLVLLAAGMSLALAGCAVGPDYVPPNPAVPAVWTSYDTPQNEEARLDVLADWWMLFGDSVLNSLIEAAIVANPDRDLALARVREARARFRVVRAESYPSVSAAGSLRTFETVDLAGESEWRDVYDAGLDASWELDIFGGIKRSAEVAEAVIEARQADYADVMTSLVAEVALTYVDLRTLEERIRLTQASAVVQKETFDLAKWRTEAGLTTALDEEQSRANLESTRAQIPALERDLAQTRNKLAFLLGEAPGGYEKREIAPAIIPEAPTNLAIGIPVDVLRRRNDIRSAERDLAAQNARVGLATANLYPSFRLTGSVGSSSTDFSELFDGSAVATNLVRSVSAPLFNAGQLRANVAIEDAVFEQSLAVYEKTVLNALREVEDALAARTAAVKRGGLLQGAVEAAGRASELATQEYKAGLSGYDKVLEAHRTLLSLREQHALNRSAETKATISLYKAAGGGWSVVPQNPDLKEENS
jgi:NodT family efflux transporter outer membrane factor (OMF) lipoprotein